MNTARNSLPSLLSRLKQGSKLFVVEEIKEEIFLVSFTGTSFSSLLQSLERRDRQEKVSTVRCVQLLVQNFDQIRNRCSVCLVGKKKKKSIHQKIFRTQDFGMKRMN
jgi:hypothetical protein